LRPVVLPSAHLPRDAPTPFFWHCHPSAPRPLCFHMTLVNKTHAARHEWLNRTELNPRHEVLIGRIGCRAVSLHHGSIVLWKERLARRHHTTSQRSQSQTDIVHSSEACGPADQCLIIATRRPSLSAATARCTTTVVVSQLSLFCATIAMVFLVTLVHKTQAARHEWLAD
jgi:hypothetical protein